jgi:hypothetical protein
MYFDDRLMNSTDIGINDKTNDLKGCNFELKIKNDLTDWGQRKRNNKESFNLRLGRTA